MELHQTRIARRALDEANEEVGGLTAQIHRHRRNGEETAILESELSKARGKQQIARSRVRIQSRMAAAL